MKTSISIATFLMVGAGAVGVGAVLPVPFQGSDTLFNVTGAAITAAGLTGTYVGGGSGNGQSAMVQNTVQHIAPMSRMLNNGASLCGFAGGTLGSTAGEASGIVIGLDAVDVLGSAVTAASAACNAAGNGLAYSAANGQGFGNYKDVLALVYGGKDSTAGGAVDCAGAKRQAVVNNWSALFQNACANGEAACSDAAHGGGPAKLWHAYRRDDASGTSDVFASILGLSPSTSASALNGFGTSPYCNALNWDNATANANCALGANKQFIGPGGVPDPIAADGVHRRPPPGTWGDSPDPSAGALGGAQGADVLPTSFQDNDPIRRTCIGGTTNNAVRTGEEVCNINATLGVVVPMPATDFILAVNDPTHPGQKLVQYPTNSCNGFQAGAPAIVFTCANRGAGTKHNGECPNGDANIGGKCQVPVDTVNNTSQCVATKASVPALKVRSTITSSDGRAYNLQMRDGTTAPTTIGYVKETIPTATTTLALDFAGAYVRNHQVQTIPANIGGCKLKDATDQIGCFVHADRCSIGFAGDGAVSWSQRNPGGVVASDNGALLVNQVAPSATTVQLLGQPGEYPMSRKLYMNTLVGFGAAGVTADELALAKFESVAASINPILVGDGFFTLGASSPAGADAPFCEDFNQALICGAAGNDDACSRNPAGIPTVSTTCGNGAVDAFEECDPSAAPATWKCSVPGATVCSPGCRC
jgi:ABC-type phosphate transport system substrate-binding protein